MVKLAAGIREDVERKRFDVKVDGLVVNEQLAKQRQILCIELARKMSGETWARLQSNTYAPFPSTHRPAR